MLLKIKKNDVVNLMIVCMFLCPYKLFTFAGKDISLIYLIWALIIGIGFLDIKTLATSIRINYPVIFLLAYIFINTYLLNNNDNAGAIAQFVVLWIIFLFSYRKISVERFEKTVHLFQIVMNIMAAYGIYEFFGRIFNLPFSDPWIEGAMIEGYNWYNAVHIGGMTVFRSNGVFLEPSIFSQYLALNILLYLLKGRENTKNRMSEIIVNVIALLFSFSGTGLLLLMIGMLFFFISKGGAKKIEEIIKRNKLWVIFFGFTGIGIFLSPVGRYLLSRLSEFDPSNIQSISAYIRFIGPFNIVREIWKTDALLGIGIGKSQDFIDLYTLSGNRSASASRACSMIFPRYAAELGIIGFILLVLVYKVFFKRNRSSVLSYKILIIGVLVMSQLSDSAVIVNYWLLLYMLNVDFIDLQKRGIT